MGGNSDDDVLLLVFEVDDDEMGNDCIVQETCPILKLARRVDKSFRKCGLEGELSRGEVSTLLDVKLLLLLLLS